MTSHTVACARIWVYAYMYNSFPTIWSGQGMHAARERSRARSATVFTRPDTASEETAS